MGTPAKTYSPRASDGRIDWRDIADRVDMAAVLTALFGPALKRAGRRLYWRCPFHQPDNDPSLQVDPAERRWKCWVCNVGGDAAALVMRLEGVGFPEAVRIVAELAGIATSSRPTVRPSMPPVARPTDRAPERPPDGPTGLDRPEAERVVADASEQLWRPEGAAALKYLLETRGLSEAAVRQAGLGWAAKIRMPKRGEEGTWPLTNVVAIPWFDSSGRLERLSTRRLGHFRGAKYIRAFDGSAVVYPSMAAIRPGAPLVICEGEIDAMLLAQELADLAAGVVTFGASSGRPDPSMWLAIARCSVLYIALDADPAGDAAAAEWGGRAIRVRPPVDRPAKDWGDLHAVAPNAIRYLWGGILRRPGTPWEELAARRWGPGLTVEGLGFVVDRPVRHWPSFEPVDDDDREERAAIMQFDGGLTREAAERAAGITRRAGP
jgi:DNA primase